MQPCFAVCELTRHTPFAFWRVGTIEVRDVLIADIPEPRMLAKEHDSEHREAYQCTLLASSNSPIAILWTGASPQRS